MSLSFIFSVTLYLPSRPRSLLLLVFPFPHAQVNSDIPGIRWGGGSTVKAPIVRTNT